LRLVYQSTYLSIEQFNPIEVPNFVVLTGVNGSGKSHLLEAIEKRQVAVEGVSIPHIVLFNYETFRLDNEPAFNAQQLSSEREAAWQFYQNNMKPEAREWKSSIGNQYEAVKAICQTEKKSIWNVENEWVKQYKQYFKSYITQRNFRDNDQAKAIYSLAKQLPYSIDEIEYNDFVRLYKPIALKKDFLPHQLGRVFWDYYVKYRNNQVNEFQNVKYGKSYEALSEGDFILANGRPPWELVNEILKTFDTLKYQVVSPEGSDYFGNFQLKLRHTEKPNLELEFSHLSSGERVLMALVASVYKSSADKHFPDLLLLDEVDASLHPSMMKNMLDVIERIFLQQGVKVILVTHSPTTLALAPEDSIYVMNRAGLNRIEKKTKQEALSVLTQGFATIEEGLRLLDQIARLPLTIITEGFNSALIKKSLELYGVTDVEVLSGVEGVSGKNQLKTIFQFLAKTQHKSKVLFVWDCDVAPGLTSENNTFPFALPQNPNNNIAKSGIENAFSESLFSGFTKTITLSNGRSITEFEEGRKRDFESYILSRNNKDDFAHFSSLINEIERIRKL
jgi:predicted ATPase